MAHQPNVYGNEPQAPAEAMKRQESQQQQHQSPRATGTFSIAMPSASNALPISDKLNDTSFLHHQHTNATAYPQPNDMHPTLARRETDPSSNLTLDNVGLTTSQEAQPRNSASNSSTSTNNINININNNDLTPLTSSSSTSGLRQADSELDQDNKPPPPSQPPGPEQAGDDCSGGGGGGRPVGGAAAAAVAKKRTKPTKKSAKLDPKSKLEKSRQSARECRARKKLRYQYLEDLVSNREKAVVKLRDELATFCRLTRAVDSGEISDRDRQLLLDQIKDKA